MQKLVWQNAKGEETDLTSGNFGITEWEGFSNAPLNIQSQTVPFQDGSVYLDSLIEQRELTVTLAMQDNNDLELRYQNRRNLISALNPKLGEGYLIYTNDFISKRIKCIPQIPLFENHNSNDSGTPKASLSWTACSPYWEDLEETEVEIQGYADIENNGDVSTQIKLKIEAGAKEPLIYNQKNNKTIKINKTAEGEINVDTNNGNKTVKESEINFIWSAGGTFYSIARNSEVTVYAGTQTVVENNFTGEQEIVKFNTELKKVFYINNIFVGLSFNNSAIITTIYTSKDGKNWNVVSTIENTDIESLIYGVGKYIAVGDNNLGNGVIYTSEDLITWTSRTINTTYGLWDIAFNGDRFVTVGDRGTIATSEDGITWTVRTTEDYESLNSVIYGGYDIGKFVAVGYNGQVVTSNDGVTWEISGLPSVTNTLWSVACGKIFVEEESESWLETLFVVVGDNGTIMISGNAYNWQSVLGASGTLLSVIYDSDKNIFIGAGYKGQIITTKDGENWDIKKPYISGKKAIAYGNNMYLAVGEGNKVARSLDGINWTDLQTTLGPEITLNSITFADDNNFHAVANDIEYISSDGETWTTKTIAGFAMYGITTVPKGVWTNKDKLYAVGEQGRIYSRFPYENYWNSITPVTSSRLLSVVVGHRQLIIAVGYYGTIVRAIGGVDWVVQNSGTQARLTSITFGNGIFVVVGFGGTILTSGDGIVWTTQTSGTSKSLYSVTFGNGLFIAVGAETVLKSVDGITWTEIKTGVINYFYGVIFHQDRFYVVGDDFLISIYNETVNIIDNITDNSDMSFNLETGENKLYYSDENRHIAKLTYRQKYIGV